MCISIFRICAGQVLKEMISIAIRHLHFLFRVPERIFSGVGGLAGGIGTVGACRSLACAFERILSNHERAFSVAVRLDDFAVPCHRGKTFLYISSGDVLDCHGRHSCKTDVLWFS